MNEQDLCPECDSNYSSTSIESQTDRIGEPGGDYDISYTYEFPVYNCACGFAWTGWEKEHAQMAARLKVVEARMVFLTKENKALKKPVASASDMIKMFDEVNKTLND